MNPGDVKRYSEMEFLGEGIFIRLTDSGVDTTVDAASGKCSSAKADLYRNRQVFYNPPGACEQEQVPDLTGDRRHPRSAVPDRRAARRDTLRSLTCRMAWLRRPRPPMRAR